MLSFDTARNGDRIPLWNGRALVSRFDPRREAQRFLERSLSGRSRLPRRLLIVGDPCGFIGEAARRTLPDAELLGIGPLKGLEPAGGLYSSFITAGGDAEDSIEIAVRTLVTDERIEGLQLLAWDPALPLFGAQGRQILQTIERRIRILNGNRTRLRGFGLRWIRNAIRNYLYIERYARPAATEGPLIIAASGPSLAEASSLLQNTAATLVALPSSLAYLRSIGHTPDLLVQTDAGHYADYHLRLIPPPGIPTAAPLSAAGTLSRRTGPVVLFDYGEPFEGALIAALEVPALSLPELGTVAASALALSLQLNPSRIILAGLDLTYRDIDTHVRPHTFDPVFQSSSRRTAPAYSTRFRYSRDSGGDERRSAALRTYREWFAALPPQADSRIVQLRPAVDDLPFQAVSKLSLPAGGAASLSLEEFTPPPFEERRRRLLSLLEGAAGELGRSASADSLAGELSKKLSRGSDPASASRELISLIDRVGRLEAP